jgi:nitrite reductase/ring-hydroxylating ferredoxin subunit
MPETGPHAAPDATADGLPLCASVELPERGLALVFDVLHFREPARAFVLRFDGRVVAYLNRCLHVPTEMDWQHGKFLDGDREYILCSTHGAAYEPLNGRCAGGPCGRGSLTALRIEERDGQVYWYPSRDTRPVAFDDDTPHAHESPA